MKAVLGLVWFRRIWRAIPGDRAERPRKQDVQELTAQMRRDIGLE